MAALCICIGTQELLLWWAEYILAGHVCVLFHTRLCFYRPPFWVATRLVTNKDSSSYRRVPRCFSRSFVTRPVSHDVLATEQLRSHAVDRVGTTLPVLSRAQSTSHTVLYAGADVVGAHPKVGQPSLPFQRISPSMSTISLWPLMTRLYADRAAVGSLLVIGRNVVSEVVLAVLIIVGSLLTGQYQTIAGFSFQTTIR